MPSVEIAIAYGCVPGGIVGVVNAERIFVCVAGLDSLLTVYVVPFELLVVKLYPVGLIKLVGEYAYALLLLIFRQYLVSILFDESLGQLLLSRLEG